MPGRGPAPKAQRRNQADVPQRGEWQASTGVGWQHGDTPTPPDGLLKVSRDAWSTWMRSWIAAHWTPADLPGLEVLIGIYDEVRRGKTQRANELRLQMDTYGLTPKGQQDRRWQPPVEEKSSAPVRQIKPRRLNAV